MTCALVSRYPLSEKITPEPDPRSEPFEDILSTVTTDGLISSTASVIAVVISMVFVSSKISLLGFDIGGVVTSTIGVGNAIVGVGNAMVGVGNDLKVFVLEIELAIGLGSNDSLTARNTAVPPARAPNAAAKITMNTRVKVTGERFIIFFLLLLFSIYLSDNLPFLISHLQYGL